MVGRELGGILVLGLALCVVLGTTPGVRVLCVGSDGHVSIEMAFGDCCEESDPLDSGDLTSSCEGCEDLLLEPPSVLAKDKSDLDALLQLASVAWSAPGGEHLADQAIVSAARTTGERLAQPNSISSIRSVVLRC